MNTNIITDRTVVVDYTKGEPLPTSLLNADPTINGLITGRDLKWMSPAAIAGFIKYAEKNNHDTGVRTRVLAALQNDDKPSKDYTATTDGVQKALEYNPGQTSFDQLPLQVRSKVKLLYTQRYGNNTNEFRTQMTRLESKFHSDPIFRIEVNRIMVEQEFMLPENAYEDLPTSFKKFYENYFKTKENLQAFKESYGASMPTWLKYISTEAIHQQAVATSINRDEKKDIQCGKSCANEEGIRKLELMAAELRSPRFQTLITDGRPNNMQRNFILKAIQSGATKAQLNQIYNIFNQANDQSNRYKLDLVQFQYIEPNLT